MEGVGCGLFQGTILVFTGEPEEEHKETVVKADDPTESQAGFLLNKRQRYYNTNLLGHICIKLRRMTYFCRKRACKRLMQSV